MGSVVRIIYTTGSGTHSFTISIPLGVASERKGLLTFCSCVNIPIQVNFRQSFRGGISVTAQCTETQLMPNESSRKDL